MRKLDNLEMMTVRIALEQERKRLTDLVRQAPDRYSQASYRLRQERAENLLALFAPGTTVTVGV